VGNATCVAIKNILKKLLCRFQSSQVYFINSLGIIFDKIKYPNE